MTTLVTVPKGGGALDVLAERYRAAWKKTEGGREQWIEGTLELADVVAELRGKYPDHREFSRYLTDRGLKVISPNDRAALVGFNKIGRTAACKLLEQSSSWKWRNIWEYRPRGKSVTLSETRKGDNSARGRRLSGSAQRKRQQRIPSVMRDDPPEPRPERKAILLKGLTREQVDPDFKGTAVEFAAKYGSVNLHTKAEIEHTKRQEALAAWLGTVADLDRSSRAMLVTLAAVDPATLQEWMRKPLKAGKMRAWCDNIQVACEAIRKLCAPSTRE